MNDENNIKIRENYAYHVGYIYFSPPFDCLYEITIKNPLAFSDKFENE